MAVPVRIIPKPSPKTQTTERPDDRDGQGGAYGASEEQSTPDDQLDGGEEDIPDCNVGRNEMAGGRDKPGKRCRLPACVGGDERRNEVLAEHVRLVLQGGVEDPKQTEDDLQRALGSDGGRTNWEPTRPTAVDHRRQVVSGTVVMSLPPMVRASRPFPPWLSPSRPTRVLRNRRACRPLASACADSAKRSCTVSMRVSGFRAGRTGRRVAGPRQPTPPELGRRLSVRPGAILTLSGCSTTVAARQWRRADGPDHLDCEALLHLGRHGTGEL